MKSSKLLAGLLFLTTFLNAEVLMFSKAYELALENANDIKASTYLSQADKEMIDQEKARLYPQVSLSAYYKKSVYETNSDFSQKQDQGLLNYTLSMRQPLYNPDTYSRIDIQNSKSEYSISDVNLKKEELAQNVFNAYLDVLKSRNKIELYKSYLTYNKTKLLELETKYEMRLANKMDLLEMKVEYNSAQIDLEREKKFYDVYDLKLQKYIGNVKYSLPAVDSKRPLVQMISEMKENINTAKEPLKVQQARIAVNISEGEIENAQDGHLPKLNFDAAYAGYDTDDPDVEAPYNYRMYGMVTLDIPIYSGGATSSQIEISKLRYRASLESLESIKKDVHVEYKEYLAQFEASIESVEMYKQALTSAELYREAINKGYEHGLKSVTDWNDAENKYYEIKYKYIENIYELVNSYIGLLIVTNNFDDITLLDRLIQ